MLRLARTVLSCLAILALLAACGPGSNKEHRYWEDHKHAAAAHAAAWPGFAPVLQELLKRVEPVWEQAVAMADEREQATRMKEINKAVGRLVGTLDEVRHKVDGIKSTVVELRGIKADGERGQLREVAVKVARRGLEEIERVMTTAKPESEVAALTALEPVIARLIAVQSELGRALQQVKFGRPAK